MDDNLSVTRANKTKQKIIDAAVILITEKGFTATTIRDICTTADVSIGAFYHHFENKQALVASGFLMFDKTLNESLQTLSPDPLIALTELLIIQTKFIADNASGLITQYYISLLSDEKKCAVSVERRYYQYVLAKAKLAKEQNLVKPEFSAEYLTDFFIKFVRGCLVDWCLHNRNYDIVESVQNELQFLIANVKK